MKRTLRRAAMACIAVTMVSLHAAAPETVPTGTLPDAVRPTAYDIEITLDPSKPDFSGRTHISAVLKSAARTIYLHGRDLKVGRAQVRQAGHTLTAVYQQVDDSGVARLDLPEPLAAGPFEIQIFYTAAFREGAEGVFHAEVAGAWYAWTQMEPIDARRVFPSFDDPRFKTPFTLTLHAPADLKTFANTPETSTRPSAPGFVAHRFAPSQPLPTYLVAFAVGPFDVLETTAPPNAVRTKPLPFRIIATHGQAPRMKLALEQGPKLLALLEDYFGIPYPFEKLDLMGSPAMGGAMENAGLILFEDADLLLDEKAPPSQVRLFGEVVAHEMAHQWVGDLVTPTWWTDIWLNEAFAEWLGKRTADRWRPELHLTVAELGDAITAMDLDSLAHGRPIRQVITQNREISSAFDAITYEKGAQVLSMFESYLGAEKFRAGIHRHVETFRHGNANADDFFRSLAAAAGDPMIVTAMRTFTDQTGVPLISVTPDGAGARITQSRYLPLGVEESAARTWHVPVCMSGGANRKCTLLTEPSTILQGVDPRAPLMPNAGGNGYYRFTLQPEAWSRLIAVAGSLPAREALALADSIWADFAAGRATFTQVLAAARALSTHADRLAALELAARLAGFARKGLEPALLPAYRKTMRTIYAPRLTSIGIDLRNGAGEHDSPGTQALRESLLPVVALEGREPALRARLLTAADALLAGDAAAVDPAFRAVAFAVGVQERGEPFMKRLEKALAASQDPLFRRQAADGLGASEDPALARAALEFTAMPESTTMDTINVLFAVRSAGVPATLGTYVQEHFQDLAHTLPGFSRPEIVKLFNGFCASTDAARVEAIVRPQLALLGGGELELEQVKQQIARCAALRTAKGKEVAAALSSADSPSSALPAAR